MLRIVFYSMLLLIIFTFNSCGDKVLTHVETVPQYVITYYIDNDGDDPDYFKVVNIATNRYQPVPAVKELGGQYYLPIMSRLPSFNNKVVEGEFFIDQPIGSPKPDTVFKVTKHLRDTLITR